MFERTIINRSVVVDAAEWRGGWDPAGSLVDENQPQKVAKLERRGPGKPQKVSAAAAPISRAMPCGHDVATYRPDDDAWQLFHCTALIHNVPGIGGGSSSPCRGRMALVELQRQPFASSLAMSVVGLPCHHVIAQLRFTSGRLLCATCDAQVALLGAALPQPTPLATAEERADASLPSSSSTAHVPPGWVPVIDAARNVVRAELERISGRDRDEAHERLAASLVGPHSPIPTRDENDGGDQ